MGRAAPPASGSALLGGRREAVEEKRRGRWKRGDGARGQPACAAVPFHGETEVKKPTRGIEGTSNAE